MIFEDLSAAYIEVCEQRTTKNQCVTPSIVELSTDPSIVREYRYMFTTNIANAVDAVKKGGVIAYPTEAVYGLGCAPNNESAIKQLLMLKHRSHEKGLILIAADFAQLTPFIEAIPKENMTTVMQTWPGPFTWLFPVKASVSPLLRGKHETLAVRITNHPVAKQLCEIFGAPIISTSANLEGQAPARSADEVHKIFGVQLDLIVTGAVGDLQQPTEIRNALTGELVRG